MGELPLDPAVFFIYCRSASFTVPGTIYVFNDSNENTFLQYSVMRFLAGVDWLRVCFLTGVDWLWVFFLTGVD